MVSVGGAHNFVGPVEIKPQRVGEEPAPEKHHRKAANVQHAILPNKTKRPNGCVSDLFFLKTNSRQLTDLVKVLDLNFSFYF